MKRRSESQDRGMDSSMSLFALKNMICAARVQSMVLEFLSIMCPNPLQTRSEGAEEGRMQRKRRASMLSRGKVR